MTRLKKSATGAAALGLLVAACTAASHLKALQPTAVPTSSPITTPPGTLASGPAVPRQAPMMQLGIDIDAYTYPGQNIATAAATDMAYIRSLHANAVMISFPFFASGPDTVHATGKTPSPQALGVLIHAAERAHLYVSVRPLLDEGSLGRSRVNWVPPSLGTWFASYRKFLLPYVTVAQRLHVPVFVNGTELSGFASSPRWNGLNRALRRRYHGQLAFAVNWDRAIMHATAGGRGVLQTVDAYPPIIGTLAVGWRAFDRSLRPGAIETEVGIGAVTGAFAKPAQHHWPVTVLNQAVQGRWFTVACRAARATHLGGIYFWSIGLGPEPGHGPTVANQGAWSGGEGARAISACFAALEKGMHGRRN